MNATSTRCQDANGATPGFDLLTALTRGDTQAFQSDDQRRTELLADVVAAAWGTDGHVIDADQFLTKPTVLRRLASLLASRVPGDVDRLFGREPRSVVLGTALALETGLPLVVVRTPESPPGGELLCSGELHPGERVLVVEAVVSSGSSAVRVVRAARRRGVAVAGVLAAIDRGVGAASRLEGLGVELDSLFDAVALRAVATRRKEGER